MASAVTTQEDAHVLPKTLYQPAPRGLDEEHDVVLCDICGQPCRPFARLDFLVTPRRLPPAPHASFP